jgi:hypothetical protein
MLSTAGHCDQSRLAIAGSSFFVVTVDHRLFANFIGPSSQSLPSAFRFVFAPGGLIIQPQGRARQVVL